MLRQLQQGIRVRSSVWNGIEFAACSGCTGHHQSRGIRLFEVYCVVNNRLWLIVSIFSKERREERRKQLREEMQRGYFDDFRDFRDNGGKVFRAPDGLIPSAAAPRFPKARMLLPDSSSIYFPFVRENYAHSADAQSTTKDFPLLTLACIAFRAGAQDMVDSWKTVFEDAMQQNEGQGKSIFVELALIESVVMAVWPFRSMIMTQGSLAESRLTSGDRENFDMPGEPRLSTKYLYHFGDASVLRSDLKMTNRLTAYAYLLDAQGRVRWRGSGKPDSREKDILTQCCAKLLLEPS